MLRRLGELVLCAAVGGAASAWAADWIMVQGAAPANSKSRFFGSFSVTYANHLGCDRYEGLAAPNGTPIGDPNAGPGLNKGYYPNNCRVGPELENDDKGVNVDTLVLGSRGPIADTNVNYFLAANFGQNAANYQPLNTKRERVGSLTDASLTFNYILGVRVRVGPFRKPGPIVAKDFVFGTDRATTATLPYAYDADLGRDWGIQLSDAFKTASWTHTYAVMLDGSNGIHGTDIDPEKDINILLSSIYDLPLS